ncbi:MAG: hypothetical protein K9M17_03660 [Mariprofundaceae bacterium]|nr:hypothetical protein [Mariprofundaceae bacterium]
MKHTIPSILVGFVLAFMIVGCDKLNELNQPSSEEVLNSYLDASLKSRSEEAYGYVSSEDKSVKSLSEYKSENDKKDNPFAAVVVSNVSFKVLKVTETGSTANADVEITLPDMGVMFKDLMGAAFSSAFGGKDKGEIEKALAKKYETGEVPTTTKNEEFHLVKEKDGWKVFLDWKAKKVAKEKEEKIASLISDAKQLRESKKLSSAIQKYEEVLALNGEMVEAKKAIEETKQEIQGIEEKKKYLSNVVLYDLKAKYYETYSEKKMPGVEFKVKNKGDRTLSEVQVTVYFKDAKGTVIGEKQYHPVLVTKYSFSGDNKPLKPNYIWQMERGKFYKADSVPSEWKEGSVSANITNIEFSE